MFDRQHTIFYINYQDKIDTALEHDVEGYEYIDGKLVPKSPPLPPEMCSISTTMTLEEFLEHDVEGYEYVKGELVPMAPPSREHGEISVNVINLRAGDPIL